MGRILEEPAGRRGPRPAGRRAEADQLDGAAMATIGGLHVAFEPPGCVARHVDVRRPAGVGEALRKEVPALVGQVGLDLVDGAHRGTARVDALESVGRLPEVGILAPTRTRGARSRGAHQPMLEGLDAGAAGHQVVERGRPGAGQAHDHDRRLDRHFACFGMPSPARFEDQPGDERVDDQAAYRLAPDRGQSRFRIERAAEHAERLAVVVRAEIVETAGRPRRVLEGLDRIAEPRHPAPRFGR